MIIRMILQRNPKGQFTVTLPRPLVEGMCWAKGQVLAVEIVAKGKIMLREKSTNSTSNGGV